jgi:hypothetical protein
VGLDHVVEKAACVGGRKGGRGSRGGRSKGRRGAGSFGRAAVPRDAEPPFFVGMPEGWEPPTILIANRSLIGLHPRHQFGGESPGSAQPEERGRITDITAQEDAMVDSAYSTPVRPVYTAQPGQCGSSICRWNMEDFYPGSAIPNVVLTMLAGKYDAWMHDCKEALCPFKEPTSEERQQALEVGGPFPPLHFPGERIRVDQYAWPIPIHVKVSLAVLGIDRTL